MAIKVNDNDIVLKNFKDASTVSESNATTLKYGCWVVNIVGFPHPQLFQSHKFIRILRHEKCIK